MIYENIENNAKFFTDLRKLKKQKDEQLLDTLLLFVAEYMGKTFTAKEIEQKTGVPAAYIAANFGNKKRLQTNYLYSCLRYEDIEVITGKKTRKRKYVYLDENSQPDYQRIMELKEEVNTYTFVKRS